MDCRHVWSVPDPMVDLGDMTIATCLKCGETRRLQDLLLEAQEVLVKRIFNEKD